MGTSQRSGQSNLALHSTNAIQWLEQLSKEYSTIICKVMQQILLELGPKGVNEEASHLLVACVHDQPPYSCSKIPCKEHALMHVLADSVDCATFAYIGGECLETSSVQCHAPQSEWSNKAPVLETAVLQQTLNLHDPWNLWNMRKHTFSGK